MSDKIANDFEAIAAGIRRIRGEEQKADQKDLNEANLEEAINNAVSEGFGLAPIKVEGKPCIIDRTLGTDQAGNAATSDVNDLFDQSFDNLTTTTTTLKLSDMGPWTNTYIVTLPTGTYKVDMSCSGVMVELA